MNGYWMLSNDTSTRTKILEVHNKLLKHETTLDCVPAEDKVAVVERIKY